MELNATEQEQIIALAYVVKKLKDDNIKLSKNFNTLPPVKGKGKGKVKGKGKSQKHTGKQYNYGKGKEEWKKLEPKVGEHQESQQQDLLLVPYSPGLDDSLSIGMQTQGGTSQYQPSIKPEAPIHQTSSNQFSHHLFQNQQ